MDSSTFDTEEDDSTNIEAWCLKRVGKNSDWLRLFENTEVTIGRGQDVTYQLLSSTYPLMISRLHCIFKQRESGEWTVTDRRSLNGVWVNGRRIPEEVAHRIKLGDAIRLGVPVVGTEVEYEYIYEKRPLKDIKPHLATVCREDATAFKLKKTKRKYNSEELEPSTSSKAKLYRCSSSDRTLAQPCPIMVKPSLFVTKHPEDPGPSTRADILCQSLHGYSSPYDDLDDLHRYSQNIQRLREQVCDTQKQVASLDDSQREAQVRGLQKQLATLQAKMYRMETLKKSFSETKKQLEAQKTKYQEELLKKQLDEALQEQKKVMGELALSRRGFAEILLAKNKELEETKEEKEKARAQKEEVVTQVTEVLENELQCIICSELFIEAVILNCAHSFCMYCIREWRKRKDECPICRQAIQSQTRCLALDNCINSMVDNLSLDVKARRQTLITERKAKPVEVMVIKDDESSSSSSSDDLDSVRDSDSDSDILSGSERSLLSLSSVSSVVSVNTDNSIQLNPLDYLDTSELED